MTKKKALEDMMKHGSAYFRDEYDGYKIACNRYAFYADIDMPDIENTGKPFDNVASLFDDMFGEAVIRDLRPAIEIDRNALDKVIKSQRRKEGDIKPFRIRLKNAYTEWIICVNPWYLRDQLEYVKNNRLFLMNGMSIKKPLYSFSDDFASVMCATLPTIGYYRTDTASDMVVIRTETGWRYET